MASRTHSTAATARHLMSISAPVTMKRLFTACLLKVTQVPPLPRPPTTPQLQLPTTPQPQLPITPQPQLPTTPQLQLPITPLPQLPITPLFWPQPRLLITLLLLSSPTPQPLHLTSLPPPPTARLPITNPWPMSSPLPEFQA